MQLPIQLIGLNQQIFVECLFGQETLRGPLGSIEVSDPAGMELTDFLQVTRYKYMKLHLIVQGHG